jgi:hypothetical protein
MTEQRRLEIIETIHFMKKAYQLHSTQNIIQDVQERENYLFEIIDAIRELEEELKNDLDSLN